MPRRSSSGSMSSFGSRFVVAALAIAALMVGCPGATPGARVLNAGLLELTVNEITFDHRVSQTACPQDVGTFNWRNTSTDKTLSFQINNIPSWLEITPTMGTVPPGGMVTITVRFNCSMAMSNTANMEVVVTEASNTDRGPAIVHARISGP